MKVYLAGPMRGLPEFNFPAFRKAAAALRELGLSVFSPAERDIERHGGVDISKGNTAGCEAHAAKAHGFDLRTALREDLEWICREADGIALLPGYEKSKGAQAELATAKALGLRVFLLDPDNWATSLRPECSMSSEGRKDDMGKDPWGLAPFDAFRCIVKVLAFGAKKYAPRNWENGMAWSRPFDACLRHLTAWWGGEGKDPETGYSHLWHAGCCIVFLIAYELRGIGTDDRPKAAAPGK